MSLPLVDFWKRLIQSGVADASTPPIWAARYADAHQGNPPADPVSLCKWLVATNQLNAYQVSLLLDDSPGRLTKLRVAPITRIAEQAPEPFQSWLPVRRDQDESRWAGHAGVLLQLPASSLTAEQGQAVRQQAAINHPSFQPLELVGIRAGRIGETVFAPDGQAIDLSTDNAVGLFSPVPGGKWLVKKTMVSKPLESHLVAKWLIDLCGAVGALHAQGLAHGCIRLDRIWWNRDSTLSLLRDPAVWLDAQRFAGQPAFASLENDWLYRAPERQDDTTASTGLPPSVNATVASDIYALGCLGYRLRFGRHAFEGNRNDEVARNHREHQPAELAQAVAQGAAGDPLMRVLAYTLAKEPAGRFNSTAQLAQALQAVSATEPTPTAPVATKAESTALASGDDRNSQTANSTTTSVDGSSEKKAVSSKVKPAETASIATPPKPKQVPPRTEPTTTPPQVEPTPGQLNEVTPAPKTIERPPVSPATSNVAMTDTQSDLAKEGVSQKVQTKPPTPRQPPVPPQPTAPPQPTVPAQPTVPPQQALASGDPLTTQAEPESRATTPVQHAVASSALTSQPTGSPTIEPQATVAMPTQSAAAPVVAPTRRRRRNRKAWFVLGCMVIPNLLLILALALQDPNAPRPVAKRIRPPAPAVIPSVTGASRRPTPKPVQQPPQNSGEAPTRTIEVVDSDQMLWAPPDLSSPPPGSRAATELLPPGPAAILTCDISRLQRTGFLTVLDPEVSPWIAALEQRAGTPLDAMNRIAMAWFPGSGGVPKIAIAVHLKEPTPLSSLLEVWDVSAARGAAGVTIFAGDDPDGFAYYPLAAMTDDDSATELEEVKVPSGDDLVDAFAVGSIKQITEVAEVGGAAVILPRSLEGIWKAARPDDAISFMTQPNFLVSDARVWVASASPILAGWIRSRLMPECGGLLMRVLGTETLAQPTTTEVQGTYVELRLTTAPGADPSVLATKIRDELGQATRIAEDFLVTRDVDPSWRLLASRLPAMWTFLTEQTRSAREDRDVIWNAYLPPVALPQITLGTLLASNTAGAASVVGDSMDESEKLTIAEMLDRPMSVSFDQESLQFAIDTIVQGFEADLPKGNKLPPINIIGGDLQKMGITQNQQIRDFAKTDVPLRTVLTDLVLGANPDKTATGPADPKQALVWVVVGEGDQTEIRVTTRLAADGQYELPKEFVAE